MKLGIFSGTFDPVHQGHLVFANAAANEANLEKVVFLPEAKPRRKSQVTPLERRLEMLSLATAENESLEVFSSQSATHSVDATMQELHDTYGHENDYYLLMGVDVFEHIESWLNYEQLFAENSIILALRTEDDGELAMEIAGRLKVETIMVVSSYPDVSSSKIRNVMRKGLDVNGVDGRVLKYIRTNKLYE